VQTSQLTLNFIVLLSQLDESRRLGDDGWSDHVKFVEGEKVGTALTNVLACTMARVEISIFLLDKGCLAGTVAFIGGG